MQEDSVDDMYFGCNEVMTKIAKYKYFEEMYKFADVWNEAKSCAQNKQTHKGDEALTKEHMEAICAYTSNSVYEKFNEVVRTKGSTYGSSFQFSSLHFLLTSAVQILNSNNYCHTAYRRTELTFIGKVNQRIRFGSFTSSSYKTDLKEFGTETCFKIKTCFGAFLKDYSVFGGEAEVLIPPYEMFNITEIINGPGKIPGLNDCKRVYVMESTGAKSNLNCKVAHL